MVIAEKNSHEIHIALKRLVEQKSERDNANFTMYQLAKAIDMPYSILSKLINPNPSKRVNNPRIETLHRIVRFFREDGFDVTIDDLLSDFKARAAINAKSQEIGLFTTQKTLPVYSFEVDKSKKIGTVDIKLKPTSKNVFALLSDEEIKPMFKRNSLFIVDPDLEPENAMLVAVKLTGHRKILIRKLCIQNNEKKLLSHNDEDPPIHLFPTMNYSIIGVVTQINAATS